MRKWVLFWYYFAVFIVLLSAFLLGDFSGTNFTVRLLTLAFLFIIIFNPVAFVWGRRIELEKGGKTLSLMADVAHDLENRSKNLEVKSQALERENARLEELDKAKTEFVNKAAHQLKTPLSAIKWAFQMILSGQLGEVGGEQQPFLKRGHESAERALSVINDWLSDNYLSSNKREYHFVSSDILQLATSVAGELESKIKEKGIIFNINNPAAGIPMVPVDPIKFSMALENLIDNAIKYTPTGGRISLDFKPTSQALEIVVSDTGIGIPKSEQSKIFQRFFRSSNAPKTALQGSGLGLSIVKEIIEGHGGKVFFESEENKGTTFHLSIPLERNEV